MMTEKKNLQPMFVAFEFSYFVVVVTVLLNVIFGIIVDTFAQLRHNNLETLHDMENSCFICSIDRFTFDRVAQGFEEHIKMDHYMWNYFYLSVHLREKPVSEHSTWEADVFSKMTRSDTAFFPISKALVLHSMKKDEEAAHANVEHSVNEIQKQMEAIGNQVQQLQGQQQTRFLDLQHALQGTSKENDLSEALKTDTASGFLSGRLSGRATKKAESKTQALSSKRESAQSARRSHRESVADDLKKRRRRTRL